MNCARYTSDLPLYADRALPAERRAAVEIHLKHCADCREDVRRWRELREAAARVHQAIALPAGLEERLAARLAQGAGRNGSPRALRQRWVLRFAAAAGVAAAALLLALLLRRAPGPRQVPADVFVRWHNATAALGVPDALNTGGSLGRARELARGAVCLAALPDLSAEGFVLAGCCRYSERSLPHALQATYHSDDNPPRVVSIFSVEDSFQLTSGPAVCGAGAAPRARLYQAAASGDVHVLKWDEPHCSYVICGPLSENDLARLANVAKFYVCPPCGSKH